MYATVYVATSLDGYIADANGGLAWLSALPNPDGSDYGFAAFLAQIDAIVMGRRTFEAVVGFGGEWPYPKPVFVLSRTLSGVPTELEGKVEILSGSPAEVMAALGARGYERLYIDGGRTVQQFLAADRVDEMVITRVPVLLGGGVPLFGALDTPLWFEHAGTEDLGNGLTTSRYRRSHSSGA